MRAATFLSILASAVLILGTGCGSEPARHKAMKPITAAKARASAGDDLTAEAPTAEAREPEYVYSPIGKRDPFRSPFTDLTTIETVGKDERRLTPLQRWGLDQLTLRGTITATSSPTAMVVDPDGKGWVVRRGTLIGKNWGKVTGIKRDCIVITEQLRDATQAVVAVKNEKCLPKTDDELRMEHQLQ